MSSSVHLCDGRQVGSLIFVGQKNSSLRDRSLCWHWLSLDLADYWERLSGSCSGLRRLADDVLPDEGLGFLVHEMAVLVESVPALLDNLSGSDERASGLLGCNSAPCSHIPVVEI